MKKKKLKSFNAGIFELRQPNISNFSISRRSGLPDKPKCSDSRQIKNLWISRVLPKKKKFLRCGGRP